ncbi:MAG: flagellar filament capping protein FliD [Desulfitobacterium hafniense]|nr:flagellar filament capping protein FliD [Desulfitobacterium hafniense]
MSSIRISGLASGLDTEMIITKLMQAHRAPVNKLYQQKQLVNWKQTDLRDINASIAKLRDKAFSLRLQGSFKVFNATSSNPSILTANPTGDAVEGSYSMIVKQLATSTAITSTTEVSPPLKSFADIDLATLNLSGKSFKMTVGNTTKEISWDATEGTYADMNSLALAIQSKIDNAFGANQVTASLDGNRLVFTSAHPDFKQNIMVSDGTTTALTDLKFNSGSRSLIDLNSSLEKFLTVNGQQTWDVDDKVKFSINGVNFEFNKTATVQDVINKVNSNTQANVKLEYDSAKDKFIISRKDSGSGKNISITDGTGSNFFSVVGLDQVNAVSGINSIFDYTKNGVTYTNLENSSNSFSLEGVNYSFYKADVNQSVTFNVTKNVDKVYDNIKQFIDQYNETLDLINKKSSEKRYRNYLPLLDEQKKEMKDKDVEMWEEKAKSGLLNGDPQLRQILSSMRLMFTNPIQNVNSDYDHLNEIGLKQGPYSDKGKIHIDEAKLKATIESNLDDVMNFFNKIPGPIQSQSLTGTVSLTGKDFNVNWNGVQYNIALNGDYDVTTAEGRTALVIEMTSKLDGAIGTGNLKVSFNAQNQLEFSTDKNATFELISGTNDALATLGIVSGSKYDANGLGLAQRIYRFNNDTIQSLNKRAGFGTLFDQSTLGLEIESFDKRIDRMNNRLSQLEASYYRKFTALEKAMAQMNQQSGWLAQQLGGGM